MFRAWAFVARLSMRYDDFVTDDPISTLFDQPFPMASQVTWMGSRAEFGAWFASDTT